MSVVRGIRRRLRGLVVSIFGIVLGRWLLPRRAARPLGEVKRVLVVRIDERVGNVLLTTPLFAALRQALPGAEIDALLAASKVRLAEGLVHVIPFERRDFFRRPWAFARALWRLRSAGYDVVLDASHWHQLSVSSALLLAWTGAPIRIAHARGGAERFASHTVPIAAGTYEVEAKLRLLEPLGLEPGEVSLETRIGLEGEARDAIDAWLRAEGLADRRWMGIAPGSRKLDHRVAPAVFAELARVAARLGHVPVVLWGPGEEALADEVARLGGAVRAPPTGLAELAALMRRARAVVANDTGPMHLSVACGAPTIALFVQGDHARWGHARPPHVVLPIAGLPREEVVRRASAALERVLGSR